MNINGIFGKIASAINRDLTPGYTLGSPVAAHDPYPVFALHRATARDGGAQALSFLFDPSAQTVGSATPYGAPPKSELAKAALSQIKRLKHPDVLRYVASAEHQDGGIFIATEPATPLATVLAESGKAMDREAIQWGLFTVSRALAFMHQSGLIHGRLNAASVFITPGGDWKLGALEAVTQHAAAASLGRINAIQHKAYQSPEFANGNWNAVAANAPGAVDSWALGCLVYHAHAGSLSAPDQLRNTTSIPKPLLTAYQKLLASNPASRAPAGQIPNHPYFKNSKFIELNMFVENIALKGEMEREAFLTKLPSQIDRLPDTFSTFKILPMLSQSVQSGHGGASAFACVVKMKDRLPDQEFSTNIVKPYATKWYSTPNIDRSLRVEMLSKIDVFSQHFDAADINGPIFAALGAAMQDSQAPALRDSAVKAVVCIVPSLTEKNLNSVLMSHFAKLQVDPEPAIRTNTTVCLGRLASRLNQSTRNKVLSAAFLRALKDPFPPARAAGANAIVVTAEMFAVKDIATRILPGVAPLLVDQATDVRNLAFKIVATFQPSLERNHEQMTSAASAAGTGPGAGGAYGGAGGAATNGGGVAGGGGAAGLGAAAAGAGSWGLSSFSSMTSALLKTDASSATASRAASGGISSEDFKNGGPAAMSSSASKPQPMATQAAPSPSVPAAFSSAPLATNVPNANGMSLGGAGPNSSGDAFGDFQSANGGGGLGDDDDDDGDGWGDMDVKANAGGGGGEEDFLAMLGPPVTQPRRPVTGGALPSGLSRSGSGASAASTGTSGTGDGMWDAMPPPSSTRGAAPARKPAALPTSNPSMGLSAPPRKPAKKSGGDDWEALLGGSSGTTTKRKTGLGATRRTG